MELLAKELATAVLEGKESPRDFIKRVAKSYTVMSDAWNEIWDDLEDWQQVAAREAQVSLETKVEPETHDDAMMRVSSGNMEWEIYKDEDEAETTALRYVEQQLRDEPELFNQDWLRSHIDTKRLDSLLWSDYRDHNLEQMYDDEDEWAEFLQKEGYLDEDDLWTEQEDEDGDPELVKVENYSELVDEAKESWISSQEDRFDGMEYLEDIYGKEDAGKQAIELVGIDIDAAAKEAVSTDGFAHFLNTYDGNYDTLHSGAVIMRVN